MDNESEALTAVIFCYRSWHESLDSSCRFDPHNCIIRDGFSTADIGFDVTARCRRLLEFYREIGFADEADWVSKRLKKIEGADRAR